MKGARVCVYNGDRGDMSGCTYTLVLNCQNVQCLDEIEYIEADPQHNFFSTFSKLLTLILFFVDEFSFFHDLFITIFKKKKINEKKIIGGEEGNCQWWSTVFTSEVCSSFSPRNRSLCVAHK